MAITTFDQAIAGLLAPYPFYRYSPAPEAAGVPYVLHYHEGFPGKAVAPSPGVNGAALTTYAGMLQFPAASNNTHLFSFSMQSDTFGQYWLCDRLWHNSGLVATTTTTQAITTPTWPARDRNGSTDGQGLMIGLEVSTATTNGSAITNTTLTYVDSAGGTGNTATIASFPATAVAGTFIPFELAAGDIGVRSISEITLGTSYGTGALHLVVYRKIAAFSNSSARSPVRGGLDDLGLPRCYDNTVPFIIHRPNAATLSRHSGTVIYTQG
jgi:hypothetical protein